MHNKPEASNRGRNAVPAAEYILSSEKKISDWEELLVMMKITKDKMHGD